jgi:hypothetical protein
MQFRKIHQLLRNIQTVNMTQSLEKLSTASMKIKEHLQDALHSSCDFCHCCREKTLSLKKAALVNDGLNRGLIAYIETIKHDRRQKRQRYRLNKRLNQDERFNSPM